MGTRFAAPLPDGSESRVAWVLWMLAGLWLGASISSGFIFGDAVAMLMGGPEWVVDYLVPLIGAGVTAGLIAVCAQVATRRLGMPPETWIALAVPPAVMWVPAIMGTAGDGVRALFVPLWMSGTVLGAWLIFRFAPWSSRATASESLDPVGRTSAST